MSDKRPDPQELLSKIQEKDRKAQRGKLKIYLGAAPGVGKTYSMLHDALQQKNKGLDVVIGVAESHGRSVIDAMLKDFPLLPAKIITYRGKQLQEFDIDTALQRRPGLILMDEMAHTNAPGMRHAKRWQDIQELLDKGIDVWTTLNVQHIESLNDAVTEILHISSIKETIPDLMIEMADTIELIDLPPEELIKRLEEGKVYFPEQAVLAAENFFRKGNLIALRELALRVTAERVGVEILHYRQDEGIKHVWHTSEKILVCVGPRPESIKLIRAAKRMATSLQTEWIAVYVDTPKLHSSEKKRNDAIQNLRFAEQLGAETTVLAGFDIVKEIMSFSREQNVTQIMVWKQINKRWIDLFRRNLADEMVRHSEEIDVYIITGDAVASLKHTTPPTESSASWKGFALAASIVAVTTLINCILLPYFGNSELIMVYLLGVTVVALQGERWPSIIAVFLSVFLYNFFFIHPPYSLIIHEIESAITLSVMLFVAYVISHLVILTKIQAESARLFQSYTSALYILSRKLTKTRGIDNLLDVGTNHIIDQFNADVLALLPKDHQLEIYGSGTEKRTLNAKELGVAQWAHDMGQVAGLGTDTLSFSRALYMPLLASKGSVGIFRIEPKDNEMLTPDQVRIIEACSNQIALAIEIDQLQHK